ncbi:MAG: addiction module protein [Thermoanaerobaculia bacterium]|nr:addiction module protein [Thermoanaerobaculia bacterium]
MSTDEILAAVLALDVKTRAEVAHRIIVSLDEEGGDDLDETQWEAAWVEEAERRLAEMRSGKVKGIPGEQVFARARARFKP